MASSSRHRDVLPRAPISSTTSYPRISRQDDLQTAREKEELNAERERAHQQRMERISSRASLATTDSHHHRALAGRPSSRLAPAEGSRRAESVAGSRTRTSSTASDVPPPSKLETQRRPILSDAIANRANSPAYAPRPGRTSRVEEKRPQTTDRHEDIEPAPTTHADHPEGQLQSPPENPSPTPSTLTRSDLGIGKVPKTASLHRWREACGCTLVDEQDVLRDVIFILQGIDGNFVRFEQVKTRTIHDEGVIRRPAPPSPTLSEAPVKVTIQDSEHGRIPTPTRHLIHRLAEGGKHYQRITTFIRSQATAEKCGRIMQSLCHFLERELTEYYELICDLEIQLNQGPAVPQTVPEDPLEAREAAKKATKDPLSSSASSQQGLTLKKVAVLAEPAMLRMRLMSSLVEGAQHTHGGSLVSLIHNYTFNGDPFIKKFTERLLEEVSSEGGLWSQNDRCLHSLRCFPGITLFVHLSVKVDL